MEEQNLNKKIIVFCKNCNIKIEYKDKRYYELAINKNPISLCSKCRAQKYHKNKIDKEKNLYYRNCSKCNNRINYLTKYNFKQANKNNSLCEICSQLKETINRSTIRECPSCKKILNYKNDAICRIAEKNKKVCIRCSRKLLCQDKIRNCPECKIELKYTTSANCRIANKKNSKCRNCIAKDPEFLKKMSIVNRGKNNPMFGKPSPLKSSSGWKSWYKNRFFRSLSEVYFIITEVESKGLIWESCEHKRLMIKYRYKDKDRNYFPDFIIDNKTIIEIKPKFKQNDEQVLLKVKAAQEYCKKNNLEYKIIDIPVIDPSILKYKIDNGDLKLLNTNEDKIKLLFRKYKERFNRYNKLKGET